MTEEETQACIEANETFGMVSPSYLMRKLKCDYEHAGKLIKHFLKYSLKNDKVNYRRLYEIIYENNDSENRTLVIGRSLRE